MWRNGTPGLASCGQLTATNALICGGPLPPSPCWWSRDGGKGKGAEPIGRALGERKQRGRGGVDIEVLEGSEEPSGEELLLGKDE